MGITAIGTPVKAWGNFGSPSVNTGNADTLHTIDMVAGRRVQIWATSWNVANGYSGNGLAPISGYVDSAGNTWYPLQEGTLVANLESGNLSHHFLSVYECIPAATVADVIVTPQFRASNGGNRYTAVDFQIADLAVAPFDGLATFGGGQNTTGTAGLESGTLAQPGEVVIAGIGGAVQNIVPQGGATVIANVSDDGASQLGLCVVYFTPTTTASVVADFTHDMAFYGSRAFVAAYKLAALSLRIKVLAEETMLSATAIQGYVWTDGNPGASVGKPVSGVTAESTLDGSGYAVAYLPVDASWGLEAGDTVAVALKGVGAISGVNAGVDCGLVYIRNATVEAT